MAAITLRKSKFDTFGDKLDGLLAKLGNYSSTVDDLKNTIGSIGGTEDDTNLTQDLTDALDGITNSDESKEEKKKKIKDLKQKIENFVNSAVQHEKAAADEIKKKKKEFYKNYEHLRPDCEATLSSIWRSVTTWIKENAVALIVAAAIVLAAIVIVIVCPAAVIAIIGAIACALSAAMGIADLVCMALTGNDLAGWLDEQGFSTLSQIVKGVSWGLDIASIILPVGAGVKMTMEATGQGFKAVVKNGLKSGFKKIGNTVFHPLQSLKNLGGGIKQSFKGFAETCKESGFLKTVGTKAWNGFKGFTGIDDIENLKNINQLSRVKGSSIIDFDESDWILDKKNKRLLPNSQKANDALSDAEKAFKNMGINDRKFDSIPLKKNKGKLDIDWDKISIDKLGKKDGFSIKKFTGDSDDWRRYIYGNKSSDVNVLLNKRNGINEIKSKEFVRYTGSGGKYSAAGFTAHENFNMVKENIVPTSIHKAASSGISHIGGISNRKGTLLRALKLQDLGLGNTSSRQAMFGLTHFGVDVLQEAVSAD